jgi:large subunit ribosomal protein L25
MATTIELNAKRREGTGKGVARKLRAARRVPGILYGKGIEPVLIDLDEREFTKSVGGHAVSNLFVDLRVDGESALVKTLIREVQTNPLSGSVEHVDLNRISLTEEIEVEVPIELVGLATGVISARLVGADHGMPAHTPVVETPLVSKWNSRSDTLGFHAGSLATLAAVAAGRGA